MEPRPSVDADDSSAIDPREPTLERVFLHLTAGTRVIEPTLTAVARPHRPRLRHTMPILTLAAKDLRLLLRDPR